MKKVLISLIAIFLIMPFVVKADTWLDDESYYDTSWFDPDTYSTTTTYKLSGYSGSKLAGLLYLVNVKGYTFSGKTIQIEVEESSRSCKNATSITMYCIVLADTYEWVPLASSFDGAIDLRKNENASVYGYQKIELSSLDGKINFTESGTCKYVTDSGIETNNCSFATFHDYHSIYANETTHGTFTVTSKGLESESIRVYLTPDEGYVFSYGVAETSGGRQYTCSYYSSSSNYCYFYMPNEPVTVTIKFKKTPITPPEDRIDTTPFDSYDTSVKEPTEQCVVIQGNGRSIGSEIACGTEHFYVLSNDGNEIKMLAKYNLYTGITVNKEKINKEADDTRTDHEYCEDLAYDNDGTMMQGPVYEVEGYCFYRTLIKTDHILQNETALSAHWDENNNYLYPQVGDVYINYLYYNSEYHYDFIMGSGKGLNTEKYNNYFFDLEVNLNQTTWTIGRSLLGYYTELNNMGYGPRKIDLLSLDEINDIAKSNNKPIPYDVLDANKGAVEPTPDHPHYEFGDLKDYLSDDQSWVYSSTYWLKTAYGDEELTTISKTNFVFIDSWGGICSSSFNGYVGSGCSLAARSSLGTGVRPVVTIPNNLLYMIRTKTDGKGEIEVIDTARGNEEITFKVKTSEGYVLGSLLITTDSGETVEFDEEEITKNEDGTLTISNNIFTMPFENVTIEANWKKDSIISSLVEVLTNPDTGDKVMYALMIMMISATLGIYFYSKKESKKII